MPLESLVVSRVDLEVPCVNSTVDSTFVPLPIRKSPRKDIKGENAFDRFLRDVLRGPAYDNVRAQIKKRCPVRGWSDQVARSVAVITDSGFSCNIRFIIESCIARKATIYAINYAVFHTQNASTHASDLLPLFRNV